MPLSRFDPAIDSNRIRLLLTTDDIAPAGSSSDSSILLDLIEQSDGSILLYFDVQNSNRIEIQYWDGSGPWKIARPGLFNVSGTRHRWIDRGPPKTDLHPSETAIRLYRFIR